MNQSVFIDNKITRRRMTQSEFNQTVDQYADSLFRFLQRNLKDRHSAEDIVQECFEKLWKYRFNIDPEKVKSWLFTTAYHGAVDHFRRQNRWQSAEQLPALEVSHSESYSDIRECLNAAVDLLPEIQRMVVVLRDYEGYSYREIGEICGLSESQVKVYIYRARLFLKNYIGSMEVLV